MKRSLLEMTQNILNDLDADEVGSIDDTVESQQVANIIKTCYYEMLSNRDWPHMMKLIQLDHVGDPDKPVYLKLPERLKALEQFRYQKRKADETKSVMADVKYMFPDEFLRYTSQRNSDNDNIEEIEDFGGSLILVVNNLAPTYWTSFDDEHIVCDSYDSVVDDTLKKSKTQATAFIFPPWIPEGSFVPDLPVEAFAALEEESKSTAFFVLKQMANQKAEQKAGRQQRWLSRKAWKAHGGVRYPDFGRKSKR